MINESISLSPIRPLIPNDPNVGQFFPSQSLQDIINQLEIKTEKPEIKPETKERPKLLVLEETERYPAFHLPLPLKTKNHDKKTANPQPSIEGLHNIEQQPPQQSNINLDIPQSAQSTFAIRSKSNDQRSSPKLQSRPSIFSPKGNSNIPANFPRPDGSSFGQMIQSQIVMPTTEKPIGSPLLPIRTIPGVPQFNVSHPDKPREPRDSIELPRRSVKLPTELMPGRVASNTPKHKTLIPSFAPVNNEYLYNVFSNKNGAERSSSNTPNGMTKSTELRSMNDFPFGKRGSFSVFRSVVEAELGKKFE